MKALRLLALVTKAIPSIPQRCFAFSTSLASTPKLSNIFDDGAEGGSAVYQHALKFQRPTVIKWQEQLENTVSLIGSVSRELQVTKTKRKFGVYTCLDVQNSCKSKKSSFRVLLMMWDGMAEFASRQLKLGDFIYVSGRLGSYTKEFGSENLQVRYKVIVKELNFVTQRPGYQDNNKLESSEGGARVPNDTNRLYLWQLLFANPHEWWDNRKRKTNTRQPDFKHKDTGECLWLCQFDPPWVQRQIQLLDLRIAEGQVFRPRSRVTTWTYDE